MRMFKISVGMFVLLLLIPRPAHAWFEWLDNLSGPGPFKAGLFTIPLVKGGEFDVRIVCFMQHPSWSDAALASQDTAAFTAARQKLNDRLRPKERPVQTGMHIDDDLYKDLFQTTVPGRWANAFVTSQQPVAGAERTAPEAIMMEFAAIAAKYAESSAIAKEPELELVWNRAAHLWRAATTPTVSWLPGSIFWARCVDRPRNDKLDIIQAQAVQHQDRMPSPSIVFNYSRLYSNYDESPAVPYAHGKRITLDIFEPKLSIPLSGRYDFLDAQTGLGVYRFSSSSLDFQSFSGLIFEPVRFDWHLPSALADKKGWRYLQGLSYAAGFTLFPHGFSADAFNATGPAARDIPGGEAVFSQEVVFNASRIVEIFQRHIANRLQESNKGAR